MKLSSPLTVLYIIEDFVCCRLKKTKKNGCLLFVKEILPVLDVL